MTEWRDISVWEKIDLLRRIVAGELADGEWQSPHRWDLLCDILANLAAPEPPK